jgi:hypothetical protein
LLKKHPEELNISDFALGEIIAIHKMKIKAYEDEMKKIERIRSE